MLRTIGLEALVTVQAGGSGDTERDVWKCEEIDLFLSTIYAIQYILSTQSVCVR
jgi:hypothetical protein